MLGVTVASHWNTVVNMNAAIDWGICQHCFDEVNQFNSKSGEVGRAALGAVDQLFGALISGDQQKVQRPKPQPSVDVRDTLAVTPKTEPTAGNASPVLKKPLTSAAPGVPTEQKPLSQMERVVDTFVAPTKTFTDLRRSANWLMPWVVLTIASLAMIAVADKKLGMEKIVENQLALQPKQAAQLDSLSPDQRAARMETIIKFNRVVAYAYPVLLVIILAIVAGVLLGSFNFGLGTELTFNQCLGVCMYASLPGIFKALIAILAIAVGGGEAFTFQNPIASNLSGLVDPSSHFLYAIATAVDVFTIWTLVLSGIGFACLTKVKRGTSMAVVFGWWLVVVLAGAGLSAAFS